MTPTTTELVGPVGVSEHARRAARAWQRMLPAFVALACAAPPASAQTYSVDVQSELGGLPVEIDTVPMEGMLIVKVTNGADVKVRCDLRYDASPQAIGRSYVFVEPGKTEQDVFRAKRMWYQVAVEVKCKADEKS